MAVDLRTVINTDVVFNDIGQVKSVQSGTVNISSAQQTIFFSAISTINKGYIIATFRADSVYSLTGFTTNLSSVSSFLFDGGGQGGTLSWQVIEVF